MEYVLFVCIVLFLTYLGYFLSSKYRERKAFFASWATFHKGFLSEVRFTKRPIDEILNTFPERDEFFTSLRTYIKTRKSLEVKLLSVEENANLSEYFEYLGKTDAFGQSGYFSAVTDAVNDKAKEAEAIAKKYTDLYIKLGFLVGLVIVILLV